MSKELTAATQDTRRFRGEEMKQEKDEPDGYVAWHPECGVMRDDTQNCFNPDGFFVADEPRQFSLKDYRKEDGYKIRPVKLVFLDEES